MTDVRVLRWSGSAAALLVTALLSGSAAFGAAAEAGAVPDISGTYWATTYYPRMPIVGGGEPPLNEAGREAYAQTRAGLKDGSVEDPTRSLCLHDGPRLLSTPYPFQVFQLPPGQVTFVHELNNQVRAVPLNITLPTYEATINELTYGGYATGRYEGDTLVIESNGYNDQTFLDSSGLPHSDQLRVTERVRRVGNQLENTVTVHDPAYYTQDFEVRYVYEKQTGVRLRTYSCGEVTRDISHIQGIPEVRAAREAGQFP